MASLAQNSMLSISPLPSPHCQLLGFRVKVRIKVHVSVSESVRIRVRAGAGAGVRYVSGVIHNGAAHTPLQPSMAKS